MFLLDLRVSAQKPTKNATDMQAVTAYAAFCGAAPKVQVCSAERTERRATQQLRLETREFVVAM